MKPLIQHKEYLKFGFVKTRFQAFICPTCFEQLSAGPDYQPKFCPECGQPVDFTEISFEKEEFLGYVRDEQEAIYERI